MVSVRCPTLAGSAKVSSPFGGPLLVVASITALYLASCTQVSGQVRDGLARLEVPASAGAVICRHQHSDGRVQVLNLTTSVTVRCPANGVLSCDGTGIEPLDIAAADLCRLRSIVLSKANYVRVNLHAPGRGTVEWLQFAAPTDLSPVAARTIEFDSVLDLQVARNDRRYVRLSRPGVSPITIAAARLLTLDAWDIPSHAGGEIVGIAAPARIRPSAYRLSGPIARTLDTGSDNEYFSAPFLPPGSYTVEPLYASGLSGRPLAAVVQAEQSTVISLPADDAGAVQVRGEHATCLRATELDIWRIEPSPFARGAMSSRVYGAKDTAACRWYVTGLKPGLYEARLHTVDGSGGSQRFTVAPQTVTETSIAPPTVGVTGTISYNGAPVSDATLRWQLSPGEATPRTTTTDAYGTYATTLDNPGAYQVTLSTADSSRLEMKQVTVSNGYNRVDWSSVGGAVEVRLRQWSRRGPAVVEIQSTKTVVSATIEPEAEPNIRRDGLAYGRYLISAHEDASGSASGSHTITITPDQPTHTVDLDLSPDLSGNRLTLTDPSGVPLTGVIIRAGRLTLREAQPGGYILDNVSLGTSLKVLPAAPFVPACVLRGREPGMRLTLVRGQPAEVHVTGKHSVIPRQIGSIVDLPNSECPVPLADFRYNKLPDRDDKSRFILLNFPAAPEVTVEAAGRRERILRATGEPLSFASAVGR